MAGIKTIKEVYQDKGEEWLKSLLEKPVVITEKISSTRLYIEYNDEMLFFKKSSTQPLNKIDRTINVLYEKAIDHLSKYKIPKGIQLAFSYVWDTKTAIVEYQKVPKNNLILTNGFNADGRLLSSETLREYSENLDVDFQEPLFEGFLSDKSKRTILDYAYHEFCDFPRIYEGIISSKESLLNESVFDNCIDSLIINVEDQTYKIADPRVNRTFERSTNDYSQLTVLDLVSFIEESNLNHYTIPEGDFDIKYINLMSKVFNDFWKKNHKQYEGVEFSDSQFMAEEYKLNQKFIDDRITGEYLKNNRWGQDLFKILIGSFRKRKNKASHLHGVDEVNRINKVIDLIKEKLEKTDHIPTFKDWLDTKKTSSELFGQ